MTNLLPQEQKKRITYEYRFRVLAMALFFLSGLVISALVFAGAGIISLFSAEKSIERYKASLVAANGEGGGATTTDYMSYVNESTAALAESSRYISIQEDVIGVVIEKRGRISLTGFTYIRSGSENATLTISGIAPTRADLASFVRSLEAEPHFREVRTPLTNFVEESNIEFSINVDLLPLSGEE